MKRKAIVEWIAVLFVLLFVYASVSKLIDFQKFRVELGKSPLLTAHAAWFAVGVPVLELVISLLLVVDRLRTIGLYAAFSLMVMFTTYIVIILNFSDYIPCTCGGLLQNMTWGQHLVFNIVFILLAAMAVLLMPRTGGSFRLKVIHKAGGGMGTGAAENL